MLKTVDLLVTVMLKQDNPTVRWRIPPSNVFISFLYRIFHTVIHDKLSLKFHNYRSAPAVYFVSGFLVQESRHTGLYNNYDRCAARVERVRMN